MCSSNTKSVLVVVGTLRQAHHVPRFKAVAGSIHLSDVQNLAHGQQHQLAQFMTPLCARSRFCMLLLSMEHASRSLMALTALPPG